MPLKSRTKTNDEKKKTMQTTASAKAPRQLEAVVHTSLPPLVKGSLRGHLVVSLEGGIVWEYSVGPPTPKLCIQLKWWGEKSAGTTFRVPVLVNSGSKRDLGDSTSLAYFPIRSTLSQLAAYLKDMGSLTFQVGLGHMTDSSMVIGQAVVPSLKQLTPSYPLKGHYSIVNSSGVHLGKLSVHIRIKTASQPTEEPALKKKVILAPAEFIIGPGAHFRERSLHDGVSTEVVSTVVGDQDKFASGRAKYGALNLKEINAPMGGKEIEHEMEQGVAEERVGLGAQQLEVISELIERGQQLRSKMVESIVNQKTDGVETSEKKQEQDNDGAGLELYGVGIDASSEEEDELNILSDVSLDESDYPLHNKVLLSALYFDQLTTTSGATAEQEGTDLVSLQAREGDLQTEERKGIKEAGERRSEQLIVDDCENECSVSTKTEAFKLSSKLSEEQQDIAAATDLPPGGTQQDGNGGPEKVSSVGSVTSDSSQRIKGKTDSLTALSSYFVKGQSSLEEAIVSAIGLEKLTQLGRVGSARITVGSLQIEPSFAKEILTQQQEKKRAGKTGSNVPLPIHSTKSPTYFVEYQFPAVLQQQQAGPGARGVGLVGRRKLLPPGSYQLMRITSKKMKDGVVKFSHHSVFPLEFNSTVIHHWWNSVLIFRVYCRPPSQRMPFLVGKAVLPLKRILSGKSPCSRRYQLEVKTSTLADAVRERETSDRVIGSLQISLELVQSGKRDLPSRPGGAKEVTQSAPECSDEEVQPIGGSDAREEIDSRARQTSPIHFKEKDVTTREVSAKPPALQLLLFIPEAIDVSTLTPLPSHPPSLPSLPTDHRDPNQNLSLPNSYLICKLFCAKPHPQTPVQWASSNPQFGIKQLFPLYLTPALLKQVNNNFTVVEVWHRTPGTNTDDELLGLVKLSLHQFYLAFSDDDSVQLCSQAELPVVAVDSYCPIVNPFSGQITGYLAVLMALGTNTQISHLQQQYASGCYTLQRPHRAPAEARKTRRHLTSTTKPITSSRVPIEGVDGVDNEGAVEHVFELCVEGVRDVGAFASTVWGEADCFVQYHFPTLTSDEDEMGGDPEVSLHPYRTSTTLCVPSPSFSHETRHSLPLEGSEPVKKYLMAACGGGLGGGVPFELWRRYCYPNIRDQLVARTSLPVAKLCAMVTMQSPRGADGGSKIQDFALPFKLVEDGGKGSTDSGGGVLDVSVKYAAVECSDGKSNRDSQHVNMTVGILRAAGLKDAAGMVAPDNPIALGLAAEVGVNAYATITLPGILKEKRTTKTIARSFSPEFSHLFDLTLPLTSPSTKTLDGRTTTTATTNLAQKLIDGYMLVELWHQAPKGSSPSLVGGWQSARAAESGVVTGRRLVPGTKDVLLGRAKVSLLQLLHKSTGICGWFALESPVSAISSDSPNRSINSTIVGGVEISASFMNEEIRDLVVSSGLRHGWRPPSTGFFPAAGQLATPQMLQLPLRSSSGRGSGSAQRQMKEKKPCFDGKGIRFEIGVSHASLRLSAVDIPTASRPTHKYCFLRYRFFDQAAVVTSPKAITCSREGIATYQLNHRAQLHLTGSAQLHWYLSEESLEVQVWSSLVRRKQSEGPRPLAEDGLLGSAFVPLSDILLKESVSGSFPLFKAGVDSLGAQTVRVEIHRTILSNEPSAQPTTDTLLAQEDSCIEVLDSSDDEDGSPLKSVEEDSDRGKEGEEKYEGGKNSTSAEDGKEDGAEGEEAVQDTFGAHVVIHQALHLPELGTGASSGSGGEVSGPSPYVTAHPHPNVKRIATAIVAGSRAPVWEHQCTTRIPNHYLQSQSQGLEFQVWSRTSSARGGEEQGQDAYIGSVHVDLCPLTCGLNHICGWYNISDFCGQTRGQLKISIAPTQRISYPSPLLAYSTLVTAASSFRSVVTPLVSSAPLVKGDGPSELSTERLLINHTGVSGESADQFSSQTRSMLFQQLREDILELDGIHKHLLTKLCPWDSTDRSSQFMPSHPHQSLKETTILRTSGMLPMDVAPPLAPPTLLHSRPSNSEGFSKGMSQSVGLQSSLLEHVHYGPDKTIKTTPSSKISLSPSLSLTQSEATSEQSLSVSPPPHRTIKTTPSSKISLSPSLSLTQSEATSEQSLSVSPPPHRTIKTTLSSKSSLSPSLSLTQSKATSEQSLSVSPPPAALRELSSSMHGLVEEEGERRQVASPEDTPTPLSGSRSGSLTDVSICSEDSSVVVQSHDVEMQSIPQQQIRTDLLGKLDGNEQLQLASNSDSSSESSSICSSPRPTLEAKVSDMDKRDALPSSERFPTSTTSTTSMTSHQIAAAPLDTLTTVTTSMPHHTQTPHCSTSGQERSPKRLKNDSPTLTSELPSKSMSDHTHEQAPPPLLAPPPPLPTFQLPNFFMTPQQLEESMRSLRAGALSQTPPRIPTHHPPPTTAHNMQAQCHHHHCVPSVASHLKTLQEVRSYLESRRTAMTDTRPKAKEISAMETQRLARIFSS